MLLNGKLMSMSSTGACFVFLFLSRTKIIEQYNMIGELVAMVRLFKKRLITIMIVWINKY